MIARGIERRDIFFDDSDRDDFLARLARLAGDGAWCVYAWALMPNHAHLLVRTGNRPLERSMRSLLGGYAGAFNRRHSRVGHLFQNRYKSILCEEESYFLTLVRYIHLNPIADSLVTDLSSLARYPYTGHASVLGITVRPWQDVETVLRWFSDDPDEAVRLYERFIAAGRSRIEPEDLDGGGLVRSRGEWTPVPAVRRGRERFSCDERILGSGDFVKRVIDELGGPAQPAARRTIDLPTLTRSVCEAAGVSEASLRGSGRRSDVSRARAGLAFLWTIHYGRSGHELARHFGWATSSVLVAARRGLEDSQRWLELVKPRQSNVS